MSDDKPFKQETLRTKVMIIAIISVIIITVLGVITAGYFFGIIGLFRLLGVQYDSFGSLLWFIVGYLLIGGIGELFTNVIRILMPKAQKWRESQIKAAFVLLSFLVNLIIISFLDNVMNSIEMQAITRVIVSFILALADYVMDANISSNQEEKQM
ncbi:hypothetical protein CEQ21_00805 [Niallia circulans]|uniref:Uncharacterized protein n=1 Tax=Niallia circulans TaxID=1397 RepID=A0A553SRC0_NIACI|nr:YrvL family regulatory protein [Niallia circulans]TRZ39544.1 hypothetical protein CEQ21_00805 [Niallia circulans]